MKFKEILIKHQTLFIFSGIIFLILSIVTAILLTTTSINENVWKTRSVYVFGIDVSHYQGTVNWSKVKESKHPVKYVFIRSTMGIDGLDSQYKRNWKQVKQLDYIRGAYHYYRPDESAVLQFKNFAGRVSLKSGDLPPILDIEQKGGLSKRALRDSVKVWLRLAEAKYGSTPILYTGRMFYWYHLKGHVKGYPLWIASYSSKHKLWGIDWTFHQFSERIRIKGIGHFVDGNDFNGGLDELRKMCIN